MVKKKCVLCNKEIVGEKYKDYIPFDYDTIFFCIQCHTTVERYLEWEKEWRRKVYEDSEERDE